MTKDRQISAAAIKQIEQRTEKRLAQIEADMERKLAQIEADLEQKLAQIEADKTRIETTLRAYSVALEMVISDMANGASMEEACHKHGIPIPRTALQ